MSQYLRDSGYTVRVFNLVNPAHSDSWNCLREINGEEMMAQIFADTIIRNTSAERGDHFWDSSEMNLLKALCLYVDQGYPDKDKYIGEVIKLLTLKTGKELDAIFELLPLDHPAKAPYQLYHQAPEQVRTSVITGLGIRLQIFQSKLMREITRYNEIDLTLPGRERCAYFCIISDQDTALTAYPPCFFPFSSSNLSGLRIRNARKANCLWPSISLGTNGLMWARFKTLRAKSVPFAAATSI